MGPHFRYGADTFERERKGKRGKEKRGKVDNFYPVKKKLKHLGTFHMQKTRGMVITVCLCKGVL